MTAREYEGKPVAQWIEEIEASWAALMETMLTAPEQEYTEKNR